MCAVFCGAQGVAGAGEARAAGSKEPGETSVRIEKVEPEETSEAVRAEAVATLPRAVPTPLGQVAGEEVYRKAYADVYKILSVENECSRFYGGPARAARVFNDLARSIKPAPLPSARTAGRMSGGDVQIMHAPTGLTYRLFEKAVLNSEGPFFRRQVSSATISIPGVGKFGPATREARALILLHELGHLLRGADGRWLLPDDGRDAAQSERNTELIEDKCGAQIRALAAEPDAARASAGDAAGRLAAESGPAPDEF